jgi:hypothetical protein
MFTRSCPMRKIRIPMALLEESHNPKRVEEDRSIAIEAAIVRIMKVTFMYTTTLLVCVCCCSNTLFVVWDALFREHRENEKKTKKSIWSKRVLCAPVCQPDASFALPTCAFLLLTQARLTLQHQQLVAEVLSQLAFFRPDPKVPFLVLLLLFPDTRHCIASHGTRHW